MTPAERIEEVLRYTRTNVKTLSERLGYARPQGLYDVAAGRTKTISQDLARKIITAWPEISQAWLLTGDGEMLRGGVQVGGSNFGRIQSDDINLGAESVSITSSDVRELISQNGKLIDIIKELTKSK